MADPLTPNIALAVPTRGSDVGTWDIPNNGNFNILDGCLGGVSNVALSNVNVVLTATQCQSAVIVLSGVLTANVDVVTALNKIYIFDNQTTGNFYIRITPPGTTGVACPPQGVLSTIMVFGTVAKFVGLPSVGSWLDFPTAAVPSWIGASFPVPFLLCDGSAFSGSTYPILAQFLGGTTLPDFRGRSNHFLNLGTGRLTAAGAGIDGNTLFAAGGNNGFSLAANQIPSLTSVNPTQSISVGSTTALTATGTIQSANVTGGSDKAFRNDGVNQAIASSGINSISVTYTNGAQVGLNNAAPGLVSGIRLIRAG